MKKRKSKKTLKKKLESLVKEIIKIRDKKICQHCGINTDGTNCHASHVIPVSRDGRLAFDPINLKVLCFHCHINWWHKFPTESGEWYKNKFPERLEYLNKKHLEYQKLGTISEIWLEEQIEKLEEELKTLPEAQNGV